MGQKKIIRVVPDTNVVVSALLFGGTPGELVFWWKKRHIIPLLSKEILDEYLRVLAYPKFELTKEEILFLITREILPWFEVVENITDKTSYVPEDPEDDKFLRCAVSGKADYLVSGDQHLLKLSAPPVPVLSVQEFLRRLKEKP